MDDASKFDRIFGDHRGRSTYGSRLRIRDAGFIADLHRRISGHAARDKTGRPSPGVARVMLDAFNITQDRISRAQLAGDPPDVSIRPRLAEFGQFEFHRAAYGIDLGRQAVRAALPEIRRMVESAAARS